MAHSLILEEDRGTFATWQRRHNGYYGYYGCDFSTLPAPRPTRHVIGTRSEGADR